MTTGVARMDNDWGQALAAGAGFGAAGGLGLGFLRLIGKGIGWLVERSDSRLKEERVQIELDRARIEEWRASMTRREIEYRTKIEGQLAALSNDVAQLREKMRAMRGSMLEMTVELRVHDPRSEALTRAEMLLRQAFEPDPQIPADLADMARRIDDKNT